VFEITFNNQEDCLPVSLEVLTQNTKESSIWFPQKHQSFIFRVIKYGKLEWK